MPVSAKTFSPCDLIPIRYQTPAGMVSKQYKRIPLEGKNHFQISDKPVSVTYVPNNSNLSLMTRFNDSGKEVFSRATIAKPNGKNIVIDSVEKFIQMFGENWKSFVKGFEIK